MRSDPATAKDRRSNLLDNAMDDDRRMLDLTSDAVRDAAQRLDGIARCTPVLESPVLNTQLGFRLLVKAESLQHTGSFKFRGALNAAGRLAEIDPGQGIIAASSGNHASAIAAAAHRFGVAATVVIPDDTPGKKLNLIRHFGAQVVFYRKLVDDRDEIVAREALARNAAIVNSSDDMSVIAGQATVGLELGRQVSELDASADYVLAPCGGGGLAAGCAWTFAQHSPHTELITVEPTGFDDMAQSIARQQRVRVGNSIPSICDGLLHATPSALPFAVLLNRVRNGVSVDDDATKAAMVTAFDYLNLVLEPNGAIALAAAIAYRAAWAGKTVAVIASGGNVDPVFYQQVLNGADRTPGAGTCEATAAPLHRLRE